LRFTLQELLKQKGLLDNHLAWLNSKIEEIKSESLENSETTTPVASTPPSVEPVTAESTPPLGADENRVAESLAQQYEATQRRDSPTMKVGCIAVVIGICLFFLFALFILPNWLYPD